MSPHQLIRYTRGHWSIENQLHCQLDVSFREDQSRVRSDNAPQNLAVMRKLALQVRKRLPDKTSIKRISIDDQHRWQGRATAKAGKKNSGICIVSAWACEQNLVLGGMKTEQKSNERKALPLLVEQLDLHQAVVSIDAIAKRPQTLSAHKR